MGEIDTCAAGGLGERLLRFVRRVDRRYWSAVFFGVMFAYTLLLVVKASAYSSAARLFPLAIGIPLLTLITIQVAMLLSGDRLDLERNDLFGSPEDLVEEEARADQTELQGYRKEFEMVGWTALALAVIWLLGHVLGLAVFVFGFVYRYERDPKRAVIVTVIAFAFVYLLFIHLLDANLWTGLLFRGGSLW